MSFDRLSLYNSALLLCGERFLASLTEENEPRRLLDHVWSTNGREFILQQCEWHFAMRTARLEVDPDFTTPDFGHQYAFSKPADWVRTVAVCQDEYFETPLLQYNFEVEHWFASIEPIYVQYVSNDDTYGYDLSSWPAAFQDYAAAYFASRIITRLGGDKSEQKQTLLGRDGILSRTLFEAKNQCAITQPTKFPAPGLWVQSRRGRRGHGPFGDGGSGSSLIG